MSIIALGVGCMTVAALGWLGPSLIGALASPWMAQAWGGLGLAALAVACVRAWRAAAALVVCWSVLSMWVLPILLPSEAAAPRSTLRIAFANVNAWNSPSSAALRWFEDTGADVVALIECSTSWVDGLRGASADGAATWPHALVRIDDHPIGGVTLLSRYPLRDAKAMVSPEGRFPMIDAVVEAPEGPVRIIVAHPVPPVGFGAVQLRDAEFRWLAQQCADSDLPTAVVADFNDTPFGQALREFETRSGMRRGTRVSGLVTTWPSRVGGIPWPAPLRIAIDHCYVSADIGVEAIAAGPDIGSDHLPLLIDISVSRGAGGGTAGIPVRPGDRAP